MCEGKIGSSRNACICFVSNCNIREYLNCVFSTVIEDSLLFNIF